MSNPQLPVQAKRIPTTIIERKDSRRMHILSLSAGWQSHQKAIFTLPLHIYLFRQGVPQPA
jgi:hypothetical protein